MSECTYVYKVVVVTVVAVLLNVICREPVVEFKATTIACCKDTTAQAPRGQDTGEREAGLYEM